MAFATHDGLIRRGAISRVQGHWAVHGAIVGDAGRRRERVKAWKRTILKRSLPTNLAPAPVSFLSSPIRTLPGLTSARLFPSCTSSSSLICIPSLPYF